MNLHSPLNPSVRPFLSPLKMAEFLRVIRSFERYSDVWAQLAAKPGDGAIHRARVAYAKKTASLFKGLSDMAQHSFRQADHRAEVLLALSPGISVSDYMASLREGNLT